MKVAVIIMLTLGCLVRPVLAEDTVVRFYSEIAAPFYWVDDSGNPKGANVELANAMIEETKLNATIEHLPWARALHYAVTQENVVLMSVLRTNEREQQLQWLGDVQIIRASLFRLSHRNEIKIDSIDQAKKFSIGSIRGYGSANYLINQGFSEKKNLVLASSSEQLWSLLYKKRIDLVLSNRATSQYEVSNIELDPNDIIEAYEVPDLNLELQMATGNKTNPALVQKLIKGLEALKENGEYQRIMQRWDFL